MSYLEISHNRNRARTAGEYKNNHNHKITTPKGNIINIVNGKSTLLPQLHHGGKSKLRRLESIKGNKDDGLAQLQPVKHAALKKVCPNDIRPRTIPGLPKNVHFSNVVDRFRPGEPASQILLTNRTEPGAAEVVRTRTEEEEQHCITTAKNNSNATEGQYGWHSAKKSYSKEQQDEDFHRRNKLRGNLHEEECEECDLEFMNTSFVYSDEDDDSLSVNEFSLDDATVVKTGKSSSTVMKMTVDKPCSAEDDSYQSTTLTALMKSLFPLGASLFGNSASSCSNDEPSILSTVTTAGERIFRGVAEAIFCDGGSFSQEQQQRAVFTYNDYNITTSGNDLLLNSVFLGGGNNQRVRIFVEMKEEPANSVSNAVVQKSTLHVSVTSSSWTLASRNRKGYEKGSIEIRAPASVQLTGVSVQGPFQGILCINVP